MNQMLRVVVAGMMLAGTLPAPAAQAAAASRELARTQLPTKGETCRPKWPYIVLTCVA